MPRTAISHKTTSKASASAVSGKRAGVQSHRLRGGRDPQASSPLSKTTANTPSPGACGCHTPRRGSQRPKPAIKRDNCRPTLIPPGTAEVTADGMIRIAGADLDWADLIVCCIRVNALTRTLTLKHGPTHIICAAGHSGLIHARRELLAIGARITLARDPVSAKVTRHTDGHTRWLTVRFAPEAMKRKVRKNKSHHPHSGDPS